MDLKAQKDKREARIQAKKEAIRGQQEAIAPTEADAVAEAEPVENTEEQK
jgi:hypothetical protein